MSVAKFKEDIYLAEEQPMNKEEISIIMRLTDVGFRAVAQEAGLGMMKDMKTLKAALDKLQTQYEKLED